MFMGNKDCFNFLDMTFDLLQPQTDLPAANPRIYQETIRTCPDKKGIAIRTAGKTAYFDHIFI
jgi:hypothetical protein